jgi:hypothetical protein
LVRSDPIDKLRRPIAQGLIVGPASVGAAEIDIVDVGSIAADFFFR